VRGEPCIESRSLGAGLELPDRGFGVVERRDVDAALQKEQGVPPLAAPEFQ